MDILSRPVLQPDHRVSYGGDKNQFGDLWLPEMPRGSLAPLVVFFHGGWWKSDYDLGYAGYLCAALKKEGLACWSVEYRRVGATGGGWPHTFQDAALGIDFIKTLARQYPLDLARVIAVGHSAGGHLAFWAAGRHHLDPKSELYAGELRVPLRGAIALAGAVDLRLTIDLSGYLTFAHDKHEVYALIDGTPQEHPDRYKQGNPGDLLPFNIPQCLIQGTDDDQIPAALPLRWAEMARRMGDIVTVSTVPRADHFDVVDPESGAWPAVRDAMHRMLATGEGPRDD